MSKKKCFLSAVLAVLVSMSSLQVSAADAVAVGKLYYNLSGTTAEVAPAASGSYSGGIVIPSEIEYNGVTYTVAKIAEKAFWGSPLTSVTIPSTITAIGESAFYATNSLKSVMITDLTAWCKIDFAYEGNPLSDSNKLYINNAVVKNLVIPDGITTIGPYAFERGTQFTSVTIPSSVKSIGNSAFAYCYNLNKIDIPDGVTSIGSYAFLMCTSLTEVNIPSSVTSIDASAFSYCTALASVEIPNGVTTVS